MSNEKITELNAAPAAALDDIVYVVNGTDDYKETWQQVVDLARDNIILNYAGDPNGNLIGVLYQLCVDTSNLKLYFCSVAGTIVTTVWTEVGVDTAFALTRVNDTNVTLTLGGSPGAALLAAASITAGWTGTLSVARGGTNAATASITSFNNITGYTAAGATGTTSTNLVFSTSPTITTASLVTPTTLGVQQEALNMNSHLINNVTNPVSAQDAATKDYVDSAIRGLNFQGSCVCASTAPYTATYDNGASGVGATLTNAAAMAAFSADGVSPTVGQRVLIKDQASTLENGIYTVTTEGSGAVNWVLTRATDFDTPSEIQPGDVVPIQSGGASLGGSSWLQTATVATVGTDPVTFIQFSASIPVNVASGGTGLTSTTAYGLIAGGTTTTGNLQNIGAGLAGQLVQSAGAAALPVFTTATFPATATGTGNLLRADGTNWLASTLTFPNTVTSGSILYGSGANVVGEQTYAQLATNAALIRTVKQQVFTANGTYTPNSGMLFCIIECVGGGGGGGGSGASVGGELAVGAGGGAGSYSRSVVSAATIGVSQAVTIGSGGTAGSNAGGNGGAGGNTTVGAIIEAVGATGGGGDTTGANSAANGGVGGNGGTGDILIAGGEGLISYGTGIFGFSGKGADSYFGAGGQGQICDGGTGAGANANGYGAGGGGAFNANAAGAQAGGTGSGGIVVITEFCTQ